MANYTYQNIATQIELLPIRSFEIVEVNLADRVAFYQTEAETSLNITPLTKQDDAGKQRILRYKFQMKAYLPFNRFHDNSILDVLGAIQDKNFYLNVEFGNDPTITNRPEAINATDYMYMSVYGLSYTYEIEQVELRQRLLISFSGYLTPLELKNIFF